MDLVYHRSKMMVIRQKNPFVTRAVNKNRKAAQNEMAKVIDEEIKKEMK